MSVVERLRDMAVETYPCTMERDQMRGDARALLRLVKAGQELHSQATYEARIRNPDGFADAMAGLRAALAAITGEGT